jgi:hypothetical protein
MTQPNKIIFVTFQKEGVHKYPAAATDPKLATGDWDDVSFLGVPHRHMFHFRVSIEVFHDDRDIEFIQFKRWLERLYGNGELQLDFKSCEMIADDLYHEINAKFPHRWVQIEVSEDGENGAVSTYPAITNASKLEGTDYEHHNPDLNGDGVVDANEAILAKLEEAKAHIERLNSPDLLKEIEKLLAQQAGVIIEALDKTVPGFPSFPGYPGRPGQWPGIGDITID